MTSFDTHAAGLAAQLEADLAAALQRINELETQVAMLTAEVQTLKQALAAARLLISSLQASFCSARSHAA